MQGPVICLVATTALFAPGGALAHGLPQVAETTLEHELAVPALEDLATWCQAQRLYRTRNEVYAAILELDPEHARARRRLKYVRVRGEWSPPAQPLRSLDKNEEALGVLADRRVEALAPYCQAVVALLEKRGLCHYEPEGERLLRRALVASPDAPDVRAILGEVRVPDGWVMEETARAVLRRDRLDVLLMAAMQRAREGLEEGKARHEEDDLGVSWSCVARSRGLRVLGTGSREEVFRAAEIQDAANDLLRAALGSRTDRADGATLYLLAGGGQHAFLGAFPGLSERDRAFLGELTGAQLPGSLRVASWGATEAQRIDTATRLAVDDLIGEEYRLDGRSGWIGEGIGGYLTTRLTGTRMTWRVAGSSRRADSQALTWDELFATPPERWHLLALEIFCTGGWELDLAAVTDRDIDDMNALDVLAAHVLAAYLVEGRTELPEVLRRIGGGQRSADALVEVLGLKPPELEWRLSRWLDQRDVPGPLQLADLRASQLANDPVLASTE